MSENGRYLLVVPKLSAMRVLDLRMGTVLSRLTYNSNEKSYNNDNNNFNYNNNNNISEYNLINNALSTGSFSSLGQSRSRSSSTQRSKRIDSNPPILKFVPTHAFNVSKFLNGQQNRRASFCSGHSIVVTPGGTGTGYGIGTGIGGGTAVGGTGNGVQLWNAESGNIIRSLSVCCGRPVQPPKTRPLHILNKLHNSFNSHQSYPLDRTVSSLQYRAFSSSRQQQQGIFGEDMKENDIDGDEDDMKEKDADYTVKHGITGIAFPKQYDHDTHTDPRDATTDSNGRTQGSDMVNSNEYEHEHNQYKNNEDDDNNDNSDDIYHTKKYDDVEERNDDNVEEFAKDKNDVDKHTHDPQLLLLATSPFFSTRYDERCGILAAASAAGITLWE